MAAEKRKVALVTGSATGIGRATAILLAERGLDVVINYSKSEKDAKQAAEEARKRGASALLVKCDVAIDSEVRKMFGKIHDEYGRLDVLVNNAARTHFIPHKKLEKLTEKVWDEIFQANVKGAFYCCRAAMPRLQSSSGSIVNVASVAGIAGSGSSIPYAASKGALITMTKSLAMAFAPNVRVNAVCPGPVATRWLEGRQRLVEPVLAITPLGKVSTPDDVAREIVFLALDATMMTGQCLVVDGGRTM